MCFDVFCRVLMRLMCFDVSWCVLICFAVFLCVSMCFSVFDAFCCVLMGFDVSDACGCVSILPHVSGCGLLCLNVF